MIQLARESGQAHFERVATHNLAEHRLWRNQLDDALKLAHRGLTLQSAAEGTTRPDRLLLARVLAAREDWDDLDDVLSTFDAEDDLGDEDLATLQLLRGVAGDNPAAIGDALPGTDTLFQQLRIELGLLAAKRGALPPTTRDTLIEIARKDPIWAARIDEFAYLAR